MIGATLFSGIGAPECAAAEIDWRWAAEIEPFPSAVLKCRSPGIPNLGDVTADDFRQRAIEAGRPDILVFGSPCQDFSIAGKRLGISAPRGNLALVALGIAERLRPRWLVFENVPGLLSNWSGAEDGDLEPGCQREAVENSDFAAFLGALRECGYLGCWRVLDAQFAGVPQRRRRIFFVGYLGDWRPPAAVLLEPESLSGNPAPRREAGEGVASTIEASLGRRCGQPNDHDPAGGLVTKCLTASNQRIDAESETFITHSLRADGFDASEDGTGRGTPLVPVPIDMRQASRGDKLTNNRAHGSGGAPGHGIGEAGDPAFTVSERGQAIAFTAKDSGADALDDLSPTLRAGGHDKSHANAGVMPAIAQPYTLAVRGRGDSHNLEYRQDGTANAVLTPNGGRAGIGVGAIADQWAVRRLTPLECERLMGLPDGWTNIVYRGKPAPDGPRYKSIGNSMAVPVVKWILGRIVSVDRMLAEIGRAAA